jgi:hypothetical protein
MKIIVGFLSMREWRKPRGSKERAVSKQEPLEANSAVLLGF